MQENLYTRGSRGVTVLLQFCYKCQSSGNNISGQRAQKNARVAHYSQSRATLKSRVKTNMKGNQGISKGIEKDGGSNQKKGMKRSTPTQKKR